MLKAQKVECFFVKRLNLKSLRILKKRLSGRNRQGRSVLRSRGGGTRSFCKLVDLFRRLYNLPGLVKAFVYDAGRNLYLSLIYYSNGVYSYILTPVYLNLGEFVVSGFRVVLKSGNFLSLVFLPLGSLVNCVSFFFNGPSKIARSAGTSVQLLKRFLDYSLIRLPSGEERLVGLSNFCSIGVLSGSINKLYKLRKAGERILKGRKPSVRGVAKNPIDHPHGGGEGRTTAGQPSVSPWGVYTKGVRTTSKFVRYKGLNVWRIFKRRDWRKF